jgi:hypothetical protein
MKIRLAEESEAEAISRFVSELAVTHIGSTLQVGGLENLLKSMDVESVFRKEGRNRVRELVRLTEHRPFLRKTWCDLTRTVGEIAIARLNMC